MPAYNPPEQVLFSPVTNYYQGKAIRLQQEMQQKELDSYDKRLELEERQVAAQEDRLKQTREQFEHEVGLEQAQGYAKDLYSRIYSIDEAVTAGELDEAGALEAAANSFDEYASTLPEKYAAPIHEKLQDGLTIDEYRQIKAANAGALEDYGLLKSDRRRTLSLEESMAIPGMTADRAQNSVVQIDDEGQLYIDDAPLGKTAEDAATRMTSAQGGGLARDYVQNVQGASESANMGVNLLKISAKNPTALEVPGSIMRFGGNLVSGMGNLADWAGYKISQDTLDAQGYKSVEEATAKQESGTITDYTNFKYNNVDFKKLKLSGAAAERFQAGIYSIAFASAVAVQGTRPTDKDIQQFIDQIGGRATNVQAFQETIYQFMTQLDYRLESLATSFGLEGTTEYDNAMRTWKPKFREFLFTYGETSGKIANNTFLTSEDGRIAIYDEITGEWVTY